MRQPRSLIVALRKIAKDPKATVTQRLRACELQAIIAGYIDGQIEGYTEPKQERRRDTNAEPTQRINSCPKSNDLRDLLDEMRQEESG